MTVVFFGHRDAKEGIKPKIKEVIIDLIENYNADKFLVGNNGYFDEMVKDILFDVEKSYPHIKYSVVLAYLPSEKREHEDYSHSVYPEGLEGALPRFAISKRNELMVQQSDVVVTHVIRTYGGAYHFKALAEKKGKRVINIE